MIRGVRIYAGLSRVRYEGEPFDLGYGIQIKSTFAHLFSAPMMAFARPSKGTSHPAPWRAAQGGGFAHDIEVELSLPSDESYPHGLSARRIAELLASLLRLEHMALTVPVISNLSFSEAATADGTPVLEPFETGTRIVSFADAEREMITKSQLQWLKETWPKAAAMVSESAAFDAALSAADNCTVEGRIASSLLLAWGALEGLFAIGSTSEVRYRVASNIACFNKPFGAERLDLFRETKKLYDARSKVAHSAKDADLGELLRSFVILRNSIVRILAVGQVPTLESLEQLKFGGVFHRGG